jgi:hypothetical protein
MHFACKDIGKGEGAMTQSGSGGPARTQGGVVSPHRADSESMKAAVKGTGTALPEAAAVTVSALLHLFRLAGAELVLIRPGCEVERFEQAVRARINQFTSPTANQSAYDTGLTLARHLVEQVLAEIRAQAEVKRSLTGFHSSQQTPSQGTDTEPVPKLLN